MAESKHTPVMTLPAQLQEALKHLVVLVLIFPPLFIAADWLRSF